MRKVYFALSVIVASLIVACSSSNKKTEAQAEETAPVEEAVVEVIEETAVIDSTMTTVDSVANQATDSVGVTQ